MNDWKYVEKDGNPDKEGYYHVVLIFDEWQDGKPTGRKCATVDTRTFCDAEMCPNWIMDDQPDEGLVWTEECGSFPNESVWAWWPEEKKPDIILPDGVVWYESNFT